MAADPHSAAAQALAGRALYRLGRHGEAWHRLESARRLDPASVEQPWALRDRAAVAIHTGHLDVARQIFRKLLPRVGLLGDPVEAVRVRVEAAVIAMLGGAAGSEEAIAYLTSARETVSAPELDEIVVAALVLALDRAGQSERAERLLAETSGPWRLDALIDPREPEARSVRLPLMPRGEVHAMIAVLAEPVDRELARLHWDEFLAERGDGAFADHARARLERLGGAP